LLTFIRDRRPQTSATLATYGVRFHRSKINAQAPLSWPVRTCLLTFIRDRRPQTSATLATYGVRFHRSKINAQA
ncbi:hypothetical protein D8Y27_25605, partial [Escherichia coli]